MDTPKFAADVIAECLAEAHQQPVSVIDEMQAEAILQRLAKAGYELHLTRPKPQATVEHGH